MKDYRGSVKYDIAAFSQEKRPGLSGIFWKKRKPDGRFFKIKGEPNKQVFPDRPSGMARHP